MATGAAAIPWQTAAMGALLLLPLCGLPAAGHAQKSASPCQQVVDARRNPATFRTIIEALEPLQLDKGEFETTTAYRERTRDQVAAAVEKITGNPTDSRIVVSHPVYDTNVKYDADNQLLTIRPGTLGIPYYSHEYVGRGSKSTTYMVLRPERQELGRETYTGSNAYGAQAVIEKLRFNTYGMALSRKTTEGAWNFKAAMSFKMPAEQARNVKSALDVLMVVELAEPYRIKTTNSGRPTVTNPRDFDETATFVVVMPKCAAIYNSYDRKILKVLK